MSRPSQRTTNPAIPPPSSSLTPAQPRNFPLATSVAQDVGSVRAILVDVPEIKEEQVQAFLNSLYDITKITKEELASMYEIVRYKGFDRMDVIKQMAVFFKDTKLATEVILAVAIQGPQRACRTKLSIGQTPASLGLPASGGQGTKVLTLNKILSATADQAAWCMKQLNVPKRMNMELPGWLQFPSAGSIKMPENYRALHMEFSRRFSQLIGGVFNEQIYMTMQANAYLDERLKLFET